MCPHLGFFKTTGADSCCKINIQKIDWHNVSRTINMFLSSTILYFNEDPVGYNVSKENEVYLFTPAVHNHCTLHAPVITATKIDGEWRVLGLDNMDVKEQVIKIINFNALINLPGELSAAS